MAGLERKTRVVTKDVRGPGSSSGRVKSSATKMLDALDLFTVDAPVLSAADMTEKLGLTRPTAYRYLKTLCESGLLSRLGNSDFCLGPRIVMLDRQIQLSDPLIKSGQSVMEDRVRNGVWDALLLCTLARDSVLCIHQETKPGSKLKVDRPRGVPFPLFRGPISLAILALLSPNQIRKLYVQALDADDASVRTRFQNWDSLRAHLRDIKRAGYAISINELQTGLVGIGVPIRQPNGAVYGSIGGIIALRNYEGAAGRRLVEDIQEVGRSIEARLSDHWGLWGGSK